MLVTREGKSPRRRAQRLKLHFHDTLISRVAHSDWVLGIVGLLAIANGP